MLKQLTNKLEGWSLEKLENFTGHANLPLFEEKSTFIQDYDENGLFVYNQSYAKYYSNNGDVFSLSDTFTDSDPEIYNALYSKSQGTKFSFYKLKEFDTVTINNRRYMYLNFASPWNSLGVPFFALDKLTTENIVFWIEQVEFIISTLKELNYPFPNDAININKLIKNNDKEEYSLCPIFGPNNWKFSMSRSEFINEQFRRLILHKQLITVDTGTDKPVYIDWNTVKEKSKEMWLIHKK